MEVIVNEMLDNDYWLNSFELFYNDYIIYSEKKNSLDDLVCLSLKIDNINQQENFEIKDSSILDFYKILKNIDTTKMKFKANKEIFDFLHYEINKIPKKDDSIVFVADEDYKNFKISLIKYVIDKKFKFLIEINLISGNFLEIKSYFDSMINDMIVKQNKINEKEFSSKKLFGYHLDNSELNTFIVNFDTINVRYNDKNKIKYIINGIITDINPENKTISIDDFTHSFVLNIDDIINISLVKLGMIGNKRQLLQPKLFLNQN